MAASPRPPSWAIGCTVFGAGVLGETALPWFSGCKGVSVARNGRVEWLGLEQCTRHLALADNGGEGAGFQFLVERDGYCDSVGAIFFLHNSGTAPLADGNKTMIAQQIAKGFAGEDFTLGHTPPRTG